MCSRAKVDVFCTCTLHFVKAWTLKHWKVFWDFLWTMAMAMACFGFPNVPHMRQLAHFQHLNFQCVPTLTCFPFWLQNRLCTILRWLGTRQFSNPQAASRKPTCPPSLEQQSIGKTQCCAGLHVFFCFAHMIVFVLTDFLCCNCLYCRKLNF